MKRCILLFVFILGLSPVYSSDAIDLFDMNITNIKTSDDIENSSVASDYIIGENDEILINVNVWGEIKKTGHFRVPSTTDLLTMLSHAGGPLKNANISSVKIVRVSLEDGEESIIYVDLEHYLQSGNNDIIPLLKPGDTIIVPGNFLNYFSEFVSIVAKLALIINTYIIITDISK